MVLIFYLGLTVFLINRMWFGKAVDDFNILIAQMGKDGPDVQVNLSNGFTSMLLFHH